MEFKKETSQRIADVLQIFSNILDASISNEPELLEYLKGTKEKLSEQISYLMAWPMPETQVKSEMLNIQREFLEGIIQTVTARIKQKEFAEKDNRSVGEIVLQEIGL